MKRILVVLALASLATPAAFARVRAVRHPAEPCFFSLAPAWGDGGVPAAGLTRGIVLVYGQTEKCAQWNGYSGVDWVTVEAAPLDAQPAAYVTVTPNPTTEARTTTIIIAGIRLVLTQEGATTVTNPNLVTNGAFDTNIDGWIWYEERFPNGRGAASWLPLDANGSPASGSILMRDTRIDLAFQRLQCFPANRRADYDFGAKVRTTAPASRGYGAMALFTYASIDCTGDFTSNTTEELSPVEVNVWQNFSFTMRTGSRTQSLLLVIASFADEPPFETIFDDVYVQPAVP